MDLAEQALGARFGSKVEWGDPPAHDPRLGPCWLWTAAQDGSGYGAYWYGGRMAKAHLVAYGQLMGPVPKGLDLDHLCRVRHCVRVSHLEAVTPQENTRRGLAGAHNKIKTHCPSGHPYAIHAYEVPSRPGVRYCQQCNVERSRARRARQREERNG